MNFLQNFGTTTALTIALVGCGEQTSICNEFFQWTPEQARSILNTHSINEILQIPDFENNIRKGVGFPYTEWNMEIMQPTQGSMFPYIEQGATLTTKFRVVEGIFFAHFTNPKNSQEYKDFPIVCANGIVRGLDRYVGSKSIPDVLATQDNEMTLLAEEPNSKEKIYTIPKGGSVIGSMRITVENAKEVSRLLGLRGYYDRNGKFIILVNPGDQIGKTVDSNGGIQYSYIPNK